MKYEQQVVIKRWVPILEEYERTRAKVTPRAFKSVKLFCEAHHISPKELRRYYTRWIESKMGKAQLGKDLLPLRRHECRGSTFSLVDAFGHNFLHPVRRVNF